MKLVARDVSKKFIVTRTGEHVLALHGFSLEVVDGEFISIVGPSGCGKTTFLRLASGLERPTRGEILLDGRLIEGPGADRGLVFQAYALFPWKTVWQNIEFGPRMRGFLLEERRKIVRHFINLVGLDGSEDKYPHELSGGMQQRAALARTFANDPAVLLMDEPLAAVDAQTREMLQEELLRLWSTVRKTVVYITHSIEESVFLSDRIVVMTKRPGRVKTIVPCPLPRPRTFETREADEFYRMCAMVSRLIREELTGGDVEGRM